jgi:hypothetical protein
VRAGFFIDINNIMKKYLLEGEIPKDGFYVYELWNPLKNLPFYVGKGQYDRCFHHILKLHDPNQFHNRHKKHTIQKILNENEKVIIKIVFSGKEDDCLSEEVRLIKKYGRRDIGTGILTNLTDGGEGVSGKIYSEEEKEKRRQRMLGENNFMFGRKRTKEEISKIQETKKERIKLGLIIPKNHTEEWKQHLREDNAGGKATAKPIYQIDIEGNVIKEWESASQAAIFLGKKSKRSNICEVANKTIKPNGSGIEYQVLSAFNFYWRWVGDKDVIDGKLIDVDKLNQKRNKPKSSKSLKQINPQTNEVIKIWNSQLDAARELNYKGSSGISLAIKEQRIYKGYRWEHYDEN